MGHHDPLDGYLTYLELQGGEPSELRHEITEMEALCKGQDWTTDDPLGIGGLLFDALRTVQLMAAGNRLPGFLLEDLLHAAKKGLEEYSAQSPWRHPAEYRLAFRELGLSIGLQAVDKMDRHVRKQPVIFDTSVEPFVNQLDYLSGYGGMGRLIEYFWLTETNRQTSSWKDHNEINMVMLATSLAPDGFLRN